MQNLKMESFNLIEILMEINLCNFREMLKKQSSFLQILREGNLLESYL